jgi:hypothetical protein
MYQEYVCQVIKHWYSSEDSQASTVNLFNGLSVKDRNINAGPVLLKHREVMVDIL